MTPDDARAQRRRNLARLLAPRHVAIVGGSLVEDAVAVCRDGGFRGPIWPVTRRAGTIAGMRAFAAIADLPEAPDATLILAPPDASVAVVAELAARGAAGAVCYAAGFAELDDAGRARQRALLAAAGAMAVVGPNCNGIVNRLSDLYLWPNPEHPVEPVGAGVALITQSGAIAINVSSSERSLPLAAVLSVGNQAVVDAADVIAVLVEDPRIRAIGLYLESLPDIPAFSAAAALALRRRVPLVLLKGGVTGPGSAKALTHSAALAIPDRLLSALCRRHGVIRADSVAALIETLKMLAVAGVPVGRRLGAITLSGGIGTLLADRASTAGFALPAPTDPARLRPLVPAVLPIANPLDCSPPLKAEQGLAMTNEDALAELFAAMLADGYDAGLLCLDFPHPRVDQAWLWLPSVRAMARAAAACRVPCAVASMLPEALPETARAILVAAGVAPLQGLEDAVVALAGAADYGASLAEEPASPLPVPDIAGGPGYPRDEVWSKGLLASAGVPIPFGLVGTGQDTPGLAARIGFPVVLKGVGTTIPHKAAAGALALDLRDGPQVAAAAARMARAISGLDRFLVEQMVESAVAEILVGIIADPMFGRALVLGRGGTGVERRRDAVTLLLPAGPTAIARALAAHELGRDLVARGVDTAPLVDAITGIAAIAPRVIALDVNPIIVRADGTVVAVDAFAEIAAEEDLP